MMCVWDGPMSKRQVLHTPTMCKEKQALTLFKKACERERDKFYKHQLCFN